MNEELSVTARLIGLHHLSGQV